MNHLTDDAAVSTWIFFLIFVVAIFVGARRRAASEAPFPKSVSTEIKGLAILSIFFAHVGYFLVDDSRFLFPLSGAAGIGVDLFLMLAGYGLATSALDATRRPENFYRRHLPKLYVPMWASLAAFFLIDYVSFGIGRSPGYLAQSFLGYFPTADLLADVNSPLWYFTFILGCYLLFPLIFSPRRLLLSAAMYAAIGYALVSAAPEAVSEVANLYGNHYLAFPFGIAAAQLLRRGGWGSRRLLSLRSSPAAAWLSALLGAVVLAVVVYLSGVGTPHEQPESLAVATLVILAFLLKPVALPLLGAFGSYSYEIYLLHWPIISRYVPAYSFLPGWLATGALLALVFWLSRAAGNLWAAKARQA